MLPYIDYSLCANCMACVELFPDFFIERDGRVWIINYDRFDEKVHKAVVFACPFRAISIA